VNLLTWISIVFLASAVLLVLLTSAYRIAVKQWAIVDELGPFDPRGQGPRPESDGWITNAEAAGDVDHEPIGFADIEPFKS
jgi:hypothetical protein